MIHRAIKGTLVIGFSLVLVTAPAFAKVSIDPDFKGSLLITGPDGNVSMLEQGESVPGTVSAESVVEVLAGQANISVDDGEKTTASCLGSQMTLVGACSVNLVCGEKSGVLKVTTGTVTVLDENGKPRTLNAGDEYPIKSNDAKTADPTAETTQNSLPADGEDFGAPPPVDARNVEAGATIPDTRQEPASQSEAP